MKDRTLHGRGWAFIPRGVKENARRKMRCCAFRFKNNLSCICANIFRGSILMSTTYFEMRKNKKD